MRELQRLANVGAGFVLGDREGGDGAEDLEGVDGVNVVIAVYVSEEGGRVTSGSSSWEGAAEGGAAGLLVC